MSQRAVYWVFLATACGDRGAESGQATVPVDPPAPVEPPAPTEPEALILSVSVHPPASPDVWLVQQLDVETSEATTLTAAITGTDGTTRAITWTATATAHAVPLLGLRADQEYSVVVTVENAAGLRESVEPVEFTNGPLPPVRPDIAVLSRDASRLEPGWILAPAFSTGTGRVAMLLDSEANVVWAFVPSKDWHSVVPTGRGTLMAFEVGAGIIELDWLGNRVNYWDWAAEAPAVPLDFRWFHHDVVPLDDGGFYVLNAEPLEVANYPVDYDFTATAPATIADHLVNRVAADGTTLERFSLATLLDPTRIGFDSLDVVPGEDWRDWAHANGVAIDAADDSLVVSLRHQNAIVKIDRQSGALKWIFGTPDGWGPAFAPYLFTPVGELQWPGHQHAPQLLPGGGLMMFDNGNYGRTTPYSDANGGGEFSRVVHYTLDEVAMTATLDWEWSAVPGGKLMSYALGNADLLPATGNVLATFSYLYVEAGIDNNDAGLGDLSTRVIEFSPTTGETVRDLRFTGLAADAEKGWLMDRAVALPDPWGTSAMEHAP